MGKIEPSTDEQKYWHNRGMEDMVQCLAEMYVKNGKQLDAIFKSFVALGKDKEKPEGE